MTKNNWLSLVEGTSPRVSEKWAAMGKAAVVNLPQERNRLSYDRVADYLRASVEEIVDGKLVNSENGDELPLVCRDYNGVKRVVCQAPDGCWRAASRVVYALHSGVFVSRFPIHIDGDPWNFKISNLIIRNKRTDSLRK